MNKAWSDEAWDDYLYWYEQGNKATIKKINRLMKDIDLHPLTGIGKPESLKHDLAGKWYGRISEEHRIIYQMDETPISIFSCKDLY